MIFYQLNLSNLEEVWLYPFQFNLILLISDKKSTQKNIIFKFTKLNLFVKSLEVLNYPLIL